MIDFFGAGYDVAEKLGLLDDLARIHYQIDHLTFVDSDGKITADLPYPRIREAVFHGRHFNFMRSDLERTLLAALPHGVEVWWGVTPDSLHVYGDGVAVQGSDGRREDFDLVIGADGVHSAVRALAFGPGSTNIVSLQARTVSYVVDHVPPGLPDDAFASFTTKGMTAGAYPLRGGRMATFFIYRKEGPILEYSAQYCRLELEQAFRDRGWRLNDLLDAFPDNDAVYFDEVVQIQMPRWSKGPIVLLGDACGCVSLLGGQGASLAVAGAYELSKQLDRCPDLETALKAYEENMRKLVSSAQRVGRRNVSWFLPRSAMVANLRNRVMSMTLNSPLAGLLARQFGANNRSLQ